MRIRIPKPRFMQDLHFVAISFLVGIASGFYIYQPFFKQINDERLQAETEEIKSSFI